MTSLLDDVQAVLQPAIPNMPLEVVSHQESRSFGDALVVLGARDLLLRVVRDRGQVFVDFGSAADPGTWYDSSVVLEHLGVGRQPAFGGGAREALESLARLMNTHAEELEGLFARSAFQTTSRELAAVQAAQAARRFGGG